MWVTPASSGGFFLLLIIAINPAELKQLRDSKLHSIISWVSSTDVLVMFYWFTPANPSCKLWKPYIFTTRPETEDSRGFTYLCNWSHNSSPERKSLFLKGSAKVAIWTTYIWLVHWTYLKCKWQKALLVLYYHFSACSTVIESLCTVLMPVLWTNLFTWLIQFVLYQLTLNLLDLVLNKYYPSTCTDIFVYIWTQQHGSITYLVCFLFDIKLRI